MHAAPAPLPQHPHALLTWPSSVSPGTTPSKRIMWMTARWPPHSNRCTAGSPNVTNRSGSCGEVVQGRCQQGMSKLGVITLDCQAHTSAPATGEQLLVCSAGAAETTLKMATHRPHVQRTCCSGTSSIAPISSSFGFS